MNTKTKTKSKTNSKTLGRKSTSTKIADAEYVINKEGEMEAPFVYDEKEETFISNKKLNDDTIELDDDDLRTK